MKTPFYFICLTLLCLTPVLSIAQTSNSAIDTIVLSEGKSLIVKIEAVTQDSIIYTDAESGLKQSIGREDIEKIKYEKMNESETEEEADKEDVEKDWRKVKVIRSEKYVVDMVKLEEIEASVEGSGRRYEKPAMLERRALVILRKKAAGLRADCVLVTNEYISAAFGEIPSAKITGVAYSESETNR
ncbi:MAG: hypothetical protein ACLFT4_09385 [Bacteroidales bacterium]